MRFTDINYYNYLQVSEQAEQEVIEAAYKRLARKYHPDNDFSTESEERMKLINQAYDVLSDAAKRKEYDRWLLAQRKSSNTSRTYDRTGYDQRDNYNSKNENTNIDINMDALFNSARMRSRDWKQCQENTFYEEKKSQKRKRNLKTVVFLVVRIALLIGGYTIYTDNGKGIKDKFEKAFGKVEESSKSIEGKDDADVEPEEENTEEQNAEEENSTEQQYQVTTDGSMLNVRKTPQANGELIQKLANGTICETTGNVTEDGWAEIVIPESRQTGWASQQFLSAIPNTEVNGAGTESFSTKAMSDQVTMTLVDKSVENSYVVIRVENNMDCDIVLMGLPTVVIAGESVDMDGQSNFDYINVNIAAGSYKDITYIIDPRAFASDTELTGTIWSASIEEDRSYSLKIN